MSEFAQQCIDLRKQDYSLPDIVRITGKSKSSIYPYIKDIPLSKKKMATIRDANRLHLVKIAAMRKGTSLKDFKKISSWTKESVLLVSHLIFDGEIKRTTCSYNNRSIALIQRVEGLMKNVYEFEPKRYRDRITGVTRISFYNVALGNYMQEKSKELLVAAITFPKELKCEILRAFFDDEGCMDFRPQRNVRQIRGYQKDIKILHIIRSLLSDFSIKAFIKKPNEVVISGKKNLLKFQKEINFSPDVRINGNRTNSIWKKHLEKRDLLARAIASFKVKV